MGSLTPCTTETVVQILQQRKLPTPLVLGTLLCGIAVCHAIPHSQLGTFPPGNLSKWECFHMSTFPYGNLSIWEPFHMEMTGGKQVLMDGGADVIPQVVVVKDNKQQTRQQLQPRTCIVWRA